MNANLPRWIKSSLADLFKEIADDLNLNYFVEGIDEDESQDFQTNTALFRLNGPYIESGSNYEWYKIEIQILLTRIVDTRGNAYDMSEWTGAFASRMLDSLPVRRYGPSNNPDNDQTLVGCLEPDPDVTTPIKINDYGQADKAARVCQMSVNGKFVLYQ